MSADAPWENDPIAASPAATPAASNDKPWENDKLVGTAPPSAPTFDTHRNLANEALPDMQETSGGASAGLSDLGTGVKQIAMHIGNHLGLVSDADLAKNQAAYDATRATPNPATQSWRGQMGYLGAQAAPMLAADALAPEVAGPMMLARAARAAAPVAEGAALGAAEPTATGESHIDNAEKGALWGGAGAAAGKVLGAVAQPIKTTLTKAGASAVKTLKDAGVPLDLAQQTGNRLAQTLKNVVADNPIIGPTSLPEEQGHAFNRAALKTMGVNDPGVTVADEGTMQSGRKAITDTMDDIYTRNPIHVNSDPHLLDELGQIEADAPQTLSPDNLGKVKANISNILTAAADNHGDIPGLVFQKVRGKLQELSKDPEMQTTAHDMQEALDDAFTRATSGDDHAALIKSRQQYRAMTQIERSIDPATGDISPGTLITKINTKRNRNQAIYGQGDQSLVSLAKAAKNVLGARNPNSGTARRLAGMAGMGLVAGGADEAIHGNPAEALKVGAFGAALPWAGRQLVERPGLVNKIVGWNQSAKIAANTKLLGKGMGAVSAAAAASPPQPPQEPVERAAGGKVDNVDMLVNRLVNRWKAAKRDTDRSTKTLLQVPDAAIVKALDVAGRHV